MTVWIVLAVLQLLRLLVQCCLSPVSYMCGEISGDGMSGVEIGVKFGSWHVGVKWSGEMWWLSLHFISILNWCSLLSRELAANTVIPHHRKSGGHAHNWGKLALITFSNWAGLLPCLFLASVCNCSWMVILQICCNFSSGPCSFKECHIDRYTT